MTISGSLSSNLYLLCVLVAAITSNAAAAAPANDTAAGIPPWPAGLAGQLLLPVTEQEVMVAPCLLFQKSTNDTATHNKPQCVINPVYMTGLVYQHFKDIDNGSLPANITAGMPEHNTSGTTALALTPARQALFRLAQKQQYCSLHPDRKSCEADTRTPCRFVSDEAQAYRLGLVHGTNSTRCTYFTQNTFARLLHWEMFEAEGVTADKQTIAGAMHCMWPPYKRPAAHCKRAQVPAYCEKVGPQCMPLADSFRFSCQSTPLVEEYKSMSVFSGDPFNATQHFYQAALRLLNMATDLQSMYDSSWGNSYTAWFLFQTVGAYQPLEAVLQSWLAKRGATFSGCNQHWDETSCIRSADDKYCSWSREIPIPGMSDAANADFPPKKCQLAASAKVQAALLLNKLQADEPAGQPGTDDVQAAFFEPGQDALAAMYSTVATLCTANACNVRQEKRVWFPAWLPSNQQPPVHSCEEVLKRDEL